MEPGGGDRIGHEPAPERIQGEEGGEPKQRLNPAEGGAAIIALDVRCHEKWEGGGGDADGRVEEEERLTSRGAGRQRGGESAGGVEQASRKGVASESYVAPRRGHCLSQH